MLKYKWEAIFEREKLVKTPTGEIHVREEEIRKGEISEDLSGQRALEAVLRSTEKVGNLRSIGFTRIE